MYKNRSPNYQERPSQKFSRFVKEYHYDDKSKLLSEVGERDVVAEINSHVDECFASMLERLMPVQVDNQLPVDEQLQVMKDDLDILSDAFDLAEEYREKYNMPLDMTYLDIFKKVSAMSQDLTKKIKEVQDEKTVQTPRTEKSKSVSSNGNENS